MFRQLDYQARALATLDSYIDCLKVKKKQADEIETLRASHPHLNLPEPDFTQDAWIELKVQGKLPLSRADIPFSPRRDGCSKPVPNAVLKVPTGGGKTWLAISAVSHIMGRYLNRNTGFVLWIVPNEAIFSQTLKRLRDRQDPYRQALDRVAAGEVQIMEKSSRLDARDVEAKLCVMLLMLQSANRQTKETLKMFQDRGDVHGFFPPEGEQQAHEIALTQTRNLDTYDVTFPMIKDSLGNALKLIRPIVVLDEGHRAISDLAFRTLYNFNPCFVLELTATPKDIKKRGGKNPRKARYANVLVEVTGRELDREGMIKMPLNLTPRRGTDWRGTLIAARKVLDTLQRDAKQLGADTNRYIRPILLVQVERTGTDQLESGYIHAEHVKDWLLASGMDESEIAIKTSDRNDLKQPENQNLLSSNNRVRAIITKQALQEGWDCPFAYVLCALAATSNMDSLTQLVGRILRQPDAMKTGIKSLDECHVITHHAQTAEVVEAIKKGLQRDGLDDLIIKVSQEDTELGIDTERIERREGFKSLEIYLPKVVVLDPADRRELDYETDVLSRIDWRGFEPSSIVAKIPEDPQAADLQLQRIELTESGDNTFEVKPVAATNEILRFDPAYAARMIQDIVPNPFVAREIIGRLLTGLYMRGFDEKKLGIHAGFILDELRSGLISERDKRAEAIFKQNVEAGKIQFRLRLDGSDWIMPTWLDSTRPEAPRQLVGETGAPVQKSLFAPIYENEFNRAERDVAVYLDGEEALIWWHRNVARTQYGLQGWKKAKIYPDFIFATPLNNDSRCITVLETKGDHLDNPDTAYKRDLLRFLSDNFLHQYQSNIGAVELIRDEGDVVRCDLVLMSDWRSELARMLRRD
ncbi:MAG: DEAD/DEAH box helicase family protein [Chloroflexota bacterium]|nr:DEAD/DEAH box helicase family protein [Chloroflexota bacterium]MDE2950526.1 DEAD/DEAH box helicase family protein [Chloroflexota bacterium]